MTGQTRVNRAYKRAVRCMKEHRYNDALRAVDQSRYTWGMLCWLSDEIPRYMFDAEWAEPMVTLCYEFYNDTRVFNDYAIPVGVRVYMFDGSKKDLTFMSAETVEGLPINWYNVIREDTFEHDYLFGRVAVSRYAYNCNIKDDRIHLVEKYIEN